MLKGFSVSTCAISLPLAGVLLVFLILRFTPVNIAAYINFLPLLKAQAGLGADLDSPWIYDETPLMITANKNKEEIFKFLIEAGADIDKRTDSFYGETVLHRAARDGCYDCVNLLIGRHIDINQKDSVGRTALLAAVTTDQEAIVVRLLAAGANPNIPVADGFSPLMVATTNKNIQMVRVLLAGGASPEKWDDKGQTAATIAQKNGDAEMLSLLQQYDLSN